jgi:uncharacterized protein with GYD domain
MPKYLIQGSYTEQGLKGLLKDGGTRRREAVDQMMKAVGGRVEAFYYAFGTDDVIAIIEVPGTVDAVALSLAVNGSGAVKLRLTALVTPEEIDQATKRAVGYRAPGQ